MNLFDFCDSGIRSWFSDGMVMYSSPDTVTTKKPVKKNKTTSYFGSAATKTLAIVVLIGGSMSASAQTTNLTSPSACVYTHIPAPGELEKNALLSSLKSIESLVDNWQGYGAPAPSKQAVAAAKQIVPSLPNITAGASAGVDGDGNVYFKLQKGEKLAYLTVEPSIMHLLVMVPGGKNIYIDDAKFNPRELPSKIRQALEHEMVG